jgi:hypothetical protein
MLVERLSGGGGNSGKLFYLVCPELGESKIERLATAGVVPKLFEIRVDVSSWFKSENSSSSEPVLLLFVGSRCLFAA